MNGSVVSWVLAVVIGILSGPWVLDSARAARPPIEWGDLPTVFVASAVSILAVVGFQALLRKPDGVRMAYRFFGLGSAYFAASGISAWGGSLMQHQTGPHTVFILTIGVGALVGVILCKVVYRRAFAT
jgi:hypothetical protein